MAHGCGGKTSKFIVFGCNLLICLAGLTIMIVCIWANSSTEFMTTLQEQIDKEKDNTYKLSSYKTAIWFLVGLGSFVFLTGFLGCCGAVMENKMLLGLYFTIILICFVAELAAGIAVFVLKDKIKDEVTKAVTSMDANMIKPIQDQLDCCGPDGTGDPKKYDCTKKQADLKNGCVNAVWNAIQKNAIVAGGVGLGMLVIELFAMIFVCCLYSSIGKARYNI